MGLLISDTVTLKEYKGFQSAFDFFNTKLFEGSLPHVMVTLQRHAKSKGYFAADRFTGRADQKASVQELALNPDVFTGRTDEEILSTLVHEMAHLWQHVHGKPQRMGYHDRQWGGKMESLGLIPSHSGEAGGKKTGQKVTHYIEQDGRYQRAYVDLKRTGYSLQWESKPEEKQNGKPKKRDSKTKFTCPQCRQNVWGKPDTKAVCGMCFAVDEETIVYMIPDGLFGKPEPDDEDEDQN